MDQNSTNGTGTDKRNWRERLGIGAKEMPKLSDEFRTAPPAQPPAAGTAKPAPRSPQPVTRTAPMAPRSSAPKPVPQTAPAPAIARTTQRLSEPAAQDALAEKLRAQRAAAEKLAEQRVQAARERAEAKSAEVRSPAKEPTLNVPPRTPPAASTTVRPPVTASTTRPKFSFADDEAPAPRKEVKPAAELPPRPALATTTPPRPALGGERSQPPFLRPSAASPARTQPPLRADGQPVFRPIDPSTGYVPQPRLSPPASGRSFGAEPPAYGTRAPVRRPPPADPYARSADTRAYPVDGFDDDPRGNPRLTRPPALRSRTRAPEEDYEEVFEDEPAPRQRASARDYQNAYRDAEPGYDEDQRRSSGPLLLVLGLLVAALVAGGAMWYYNTIIKTSTTALPGTTDSIPVIAAPEQPAKSAPEKPVEVQGQAPAVKKKQIYDRIVGDQEVSGDQVVPTEEIPVQPEATEPPISGQAVPEQGAGQIPAPDVPLDAATGQAAPVTEETAPLPLPPPPGADTQGSLDQSAIEKIAAAAASPEQGATAPPGAAPAVDLPDPVAALPPPEKTTDGAVTISEPAAAVTEAVEPPPPPAKKKATAAKQATATKAKKKATAPAEDLGAEPVVLVPPSQAGSPIQGEDTASAPVSQQGAAPAPVKKKKTILDLFNGSSSDDAPAAPGQQGALEQDDTQVASLPASAAKKPAAAPAPEPQQASTGSGYVVQLASFRSEDEAQSEFSRLRDRYPDVVGGLPSRISQTSAGGSTRYRLGLGPLASRDAATKVCNSLFSAGERDCLVRSQ